MRAKGWTRNRNGVRPTRAAARFGMFATRDSLPTAHGWRKLLRPRLTHFTLAAFARFLSAPPHAICPSNLFPFREPPQNLAETLVTITKSANAESP